MKFAQNRRSAEEKPALKTGLGNFFLLCASASLREKFPAQTP